MTVTRDFLTDTLDLAVDLDDRAEQICDYIRANNIDALWTRAVQAAHKETGLPLPTRFHNAAYAQRGVSYDLNMRYGTLVFEGYDQDGDWHTYSVPVDFLFPETRDAAVARLTEGYREQARKQAQDTQADAERTAAAQRARDEAEFERLGQALGRL